MSENKLVFVKSPAQQSQIDAIERLEPSTCTEAETFVLQVLDDSMEPEFKQRCMIVIDPTGHAKNGSYVFARKLDKASQSTIADNSTDISATNATETVDNYQFRQLLSGSDGSWHLCPLNDAYPSRVTPADFSEIVGVIVQRAGTRRRYHKRYD